MERNKIIKKNVIWGFGINLLGMIISYFVVPISLRYLGLGDYGLWATIGSIVAWISIFNVGIGNGLRNQLTSFVSLKKEKDIQESVATGYYLLTFIVVILLIICLIITWNVNWCKVLNTNNYTEKYLALVVSINGFFCLVNFVATLIQSVYYSVQKSAMVSAIKIVMQIVNCCSIVVLLVGVHSHKLLWIAVAYGASGFLANMIFTMVFMKKNPLFIPKIRYFSKEKIRSLLNIGGKIFLIQISGLIIYTTDNLIIIHIFGTKPVAVYSLVIKIFSLLLFLQGIYLAPLWSAATDAQAKHDYIWLRNIVRKINKLQLLLTGLCVISIFFMKYAIILWTGNSSLVFPKYLISISAIYVIALIWSNSYFTFCNGLNILKVPLILAIFQAVINIPISIYLAKYVFHSSTGVIAGTVVTLISGVIVLPLVYHLYLRAKLKKSLH